ncbi:LytTR family DNA-binding domain-containing protein [Saccharophagus degradans]|uniref:LytR/AlgR family response regulator transcription factor n=1 Tax=Saccharophagus degradans TaxID=86304 RepID=UPI0024781A0D|nr:LytTR family DNA-binding domain-containing protein [Saccharophagus degradans]WGO98564.1 LytTR family DNA-binding domain-containing protein [Saccharophagus degradans]
MRKIINWYGFEGRLALIFWLGYMAWLVVFCVIHQMVIMDSGVNVVSSILWTLREWGFWMLITPTLVSLLSKTEHYEKPLKAKLHILGAALIVALLYKVAVNLYSGRSDVLATFVSYSPKYLQVLLVISLGWYVLLKGEQVYYANKNSSTEPDSPKNDASRLLVSTGSAEAFIHVQDITAVQAAGNYVDIHTANSSYILRATLKHLLEQLPQAQFVRCHRSAVVNINYVKQLHSFATGKGELELECGRLVPLAKSYRTQFKQSVINTADC